MPLVGKLTVFPLKHFPLYRKQYGGPSIAAAPFTFPPAMHKDSNFFTPTPTFVISFFLFNNSHLNEYKMPADVFKIIWVGGLANTT